MSPPRHWLVRLYPKAWQERYGDELQDLIETEGAGLRGHYDIAKAALGERLFDRSALRGGKSRQGGGTLALTLRTPSALIPLVMSAFAFLVVVASLAAFGASHGHDEGVAAHLFQLLIAGQLPFLAWFYVRAHRRRRTAALTVHLAALALAFVPVWYMGL